MCDYQLHLACTCDCAVLSLLCALRCLDLRLAMLQPAVIDEICMFVSSMHRIRLCMCSCGRLM